jgi:hypothetical protein
MWIVIHDPNPALAPRYIGPFATDALAQAWCNNTPDVFGYSIVFLEKP